MYLIMYEDKTGICLLPRYYVSHVWDINNGLTNFYKEHPYETICEAMFDDIIRSITIEQAVALHNALCPQFHITSIIKTDHYVYSETKIEKGETNES